MNVEVTPEGILVVLSRRNLLALLAKLDGYPQESRATLARQTDAGLIVVQAVDDKSHYGEREPGALHSETEDLLVEAHDTHYDELLSRDD